MILGSQHWTCSGTPQAVSEHALRLLCIIDVSACVEPHAQLEDLGHRRCTGVQAPEYLERLKALMHSTEHP